VKCTDCNTVVTIIKVGYVLENYFLIPRVSKCEEVLLRMIYAIPISDNPGVKELI